MFVFIWDTKFGRRRQLIVFKKNTDTIFMTRGVSDYAGMEIRSGEVSDVLFCRIFFQYMGSLQMPHTWKQGPSLSCINTCIKRIESEGREPILVSLELHSNSLKLVNNSGNTIRVFPFHTLVYTGASTSNTQCMVVVTRSSLSDYSPQPQDGNFGKIMNISHAFRIQPSQSVIKYHGPAKAQRLMRNLDVVDYPQDALRVLKMFVRMFELCTKYEPSLKKPRPQYDNVSGYVILIDFRANTHDLSSSSEHSPFVSLQPSSSDGSMTDNLSFTVSENSQKFDSVFDNLATHSDTRLNGKFNQMKTSSTSLDCITKYQTKHTKQGSYSSLHESSLLQIPTPQRRKPQNKPLSESQPCLSNNKMQVERWLESLDNLLHDPIGVDLFRDFLITQICVENLEFWLAVEKYKILKNPIEIGLHKSAIFQRFIHDKAPSQVNLDLKLRKGIFANMQLPDTSIFNQAQKQIYHTLRFDCYPRFKNSTILSDYIRENRYTHLKDSVNSEDIRIKNSISDIHSSSQSIDPNTSLSEIDKPHRHTSNPLSFIRRSFNKRKNSSTKDNTAEEFTFVRNTIPSNQEQTEQSVYLHVPGRDKFLVELNPEQTLGEVLRPVLNNLKLLPELYEYRQADNLNIIELYKNSLFFSGKNILLQQHTESFILTMQLSSQPTQEYILRTSSSKTILDIIQPILNLKGLTKDAVSLHLADCNVPIQLELQSTVLNKQKVEMIGQDNFGTLKVKTGSFTSLESSPTRDSKQELFKTQYPKRKVNKIRTSLRGKKEKTAKNKEMFSLIESAQGNRLNDQRSEKQDYPNLSEKPPRIPANSNTNRSNNADICPHTGEVLFQNPQDVYQQKHTVVENRQIVPPKDRSNTDPPKYTPHKPTTRVPLNLAEAKFQQNQLTSFAPSLRFNNNNNTNKYHIAPDVQANSYNYTQNYNPYQTAMQPHSSLPVAPVYPMQRSQQSLFYKGTQHLASTKVTTHYNSGYIEKTNDLYRGPPVTTATRAILAVPSPFDDCNLPSRMNFSQKLSPMSAVHTHLASPVIHGYRQVQVNEQKLTNSYQKPVSTPSYL